jgi:hypothetical protein
MAMLKRFKHDRITEFMCSVSVQIELAGGEFEDPVAVRLVTLIVGH